MVLGGQKESDFGTRVLVGCYMERQSRAKARGSPGIISWGLRKQVVGLGRKVEGDEIRICVRAVVTWKKPLLGSAGRL